MGIEGIIEGIKFFGGISGLAALGWKLYETFASYLQLDLNLTKDGDHVTALTSLSNRGVSPKTLDYALLLIGPEPEDPVRTAQQIAGSLKPLPAYLGKIKRTDDIVMVRIPGDSPCYAGACRALIPLSGGSIAGST